MTTITKTTELTHFAPNSCPDWCTLSGRHHPEVDDVNADGSFTRGHAGPNIGDITISIGGNEDSSRPGVIAYTVLAEETEWNGREEAIAGLRALAADAEAAARWLESQA